MEVSQRNEDRRKRLSRRAVLMTVCTAMGVWRGGSSFAQDSDTVILKESRQNYTIVSQIENAEERQSFLELYGTREPERRHALASQFLATYPQSWLLSQVYDVAAKSSIDLGHFQQALEEGQISLRLLPENPMLLVLVANLEAQSKLFSKAETDARDALDYLEQFARPGSIAASQWEHVKPQLQASAYFALGRACAGRAFVETSDSKAAALFADARQALDHAAAFNPRDPEIFYLRGIVKARLGQAEHAASDLAFAARNSAPLRPTATQALQLLYQKSARKASTSFDQFVAGLEKPEIDKSLCCEMTESKPLAAIREGYAGSSECRNCHQWEYETWSRTGMANMLRPYKRENILGDFSPGAEYRDEQGHVAIRMGVDSRPYFDVLRSEGRWQRFRVDYTIGSKWQQGYATRLSDARLQVIPIEYNAIQKAWINYWKIIDPPGSKRAVISEFPKLSAETNYQKSCAICHTSQLRAAPNDENPMEHATFSQPGVNCEMCHGPSALHIKEARAGHLRNKDPSEPPIDFRKVGNRDGIRVCAQCHRQSALREIGEQNEMNFSMTKASFVPRTWSGPYDAFSRRAFYKDGRFRETTFIVEAFTRSACYRKGTAQCASCHAPHIPDFPHNLTSLKFKEHPNDMCLSCHDKFRTNVAGHTHHEAESEASQCVSCHMPRIINALLFQARSHQIEIPRADMTLRFGQADSPNACLLCHADRDGHWAQQELEKWRG